MRGRKPKPTHLKLLAGNPGRRPINDSEPLPVGDLLEPPDWLSESQLEGWGYVMDQAPAGLLKRIDRALLTLWVVAEDIHHQAAEALANQNVIVTTRNGEMSQNLYLTIMNRQVPLMLKVASELGFTPASRSRIRLPAGGRKGKEESPFAKFVRD